ncbi:MAG: uracil-DNA glycosylase family protein [Bacteroidales bacterium]|nr:uracil-DNA glycosylase family protein [Bacteroidales bacterium]
MGQPDIERHPLQPFLPPNARLLMLGSFPPPRKRWCMDFFYPNRTNMMWEIFGLVFFGDSQRLVDAEHKTFRMEDIKALLEEHGVAIFDTACAVRRLSGNASDKDLEIVEKTDIPLLLSKIPQCHDIVCTGQKSFSVLTEDYGVPVPQMGTYNDFTIAGRTMRLWRMPSSSRAYPMKLEEKATYYREMMEQIGILAT